MDPYSDYGSTKLLKTNPIWIFIRIHNTGSNYWPVFRIHWIRIRPNIWFWIQAHSWNWYKIISYSEDFPVKRSPLKDVPVLFLKLKLFCCDLTFFFLSPWIRIPNPDLEEPWIRIRNTATDCITHCCRWWGGLRRSCWRRSRWCLTTTRPQPPWEDSDYSNYYYY